MNKTKRIVDKYNKDVTWVNGEYEGKNQDICICHQHCIHFKPGQEDNCAIAETSFGLSKEVGVVLVYACDRYARKRVIHHREWDNGDFHHWYECGYCGKQCKHDGCIPCNNPDQVSDVQIFLSKDEDG